MYVEPDDLPIFEQYEAVLHQHQGQILPVFLECSDDELVQRVGNADRVERRKMGSEQSMRKFLAQYTAVPVPRQNCLRLDSGIDSADSNAEKIVRHFGLRHT